MVNLSHNESDKILNISIDSMFRNEDLRTKKIIEDLLENLILKFIDTDIFILNKNIDRNFTWKLYIDIFLFCDIKMSLLQLLQIGNYKILN